MFFFENILDHFFLELSNVLDTKSEGNVEKMYFFWILNVKLQI